MSKNQKSIEIPSTRKKKINPFIERKIMLNYDVKHTPLSLSPILPSIPYEWVNPVWPILGLVNDGIYLNVKI